MVVSVIMYNCSSWAATKDVLEKLDVCHRKHLRQILKIKWPTTITNVKLYEIYAKQHHYLYVLKHLVGKCLGTF